mgnify:CR=1 FL=1
MRLMLTVLVASVLLAPTASADFTDTFTYADGTFPPEWTWTGDPRGAGFFEVHAEAFVHVDGGHVHYFRDLEVCGAGTYEFDVTDTEWVFAWRITPGNPDAGKCLCFYHNDYYGWSYNFVEFTWSTLGGYPDGQYMWHNGSHTAHAQYGASPPVGQHHVRIEDMGSWVSIWVDDDLIFDRAFVSIPSGYIGLGCDGPGVMTPAFDNVSFHEEPSPVEPATWGTVKALFK